MSTDILKRKIRNFPIANLSVRIAAASLSLAAWGRAGRARGGSSTFRLAHAGRKPTRRR